MVKVSEENINQTIHDILNVIQVLKGIEGYCLDKNERCVTQISLLHSCELRLLEIRQKILGSVEDNDNEI